MDDNCRPRRLIGKGVAYQAEVNGTAQLTDGSEKNGLIQLNPPSSPSGSGLTVTDANGTVLRMDQFKEGDILTIEGGQIVFKSNQDQKNTYDPSLLRDGVGRLAVFICGPNGTTSIGRYDGCSDGILGFSPDPEIAPALTPTCFSWSSIASKMVEFLCAQIPAVAEADTLVGNIVCTNNGVRKGGAANSYIWLTSPVLGINIHQYSSGNPYGPISYFLPGGATATLVLTPPPNSTNNILLTSIAEYNTSYRNVVIQLAIKAITLTEFFDVVVTINGIEHIRTLCVPEISGVGECNYNQIVVPIPDTNIIEFGLRIQKHNVGTYGMVLAYAAIVGFVK